MQIRVFDFSGVYREQEYSFPEGTEFLDLRGIEGTSCYCDDAAARLINKYLATRCQDTAGVRGGLGECLTQYGPIVSGINFVDSGDYHYVTALHCAVLHERFNLLLLDNHPDMQEPAFGNILSCGGWVRKMLQENKNLNKVLIAGIDPALAAETEGFPRRVTVLTREEKDLHDKIKTWLDSLQEPLYISIDKDVLARGYASTDWEQGTMTLDTLKEILVNIGNWHRASGGRVLGIDICGELPSNKCGGQEDFALNNRTNLILLSLCENL